MSSRLDEALVLRGLFATRSRARDAIRRGTVRVEGVPARKAGQEVGDEASLTVDDPARTYVSRAALKLTAGLDAFGLDPSGSDCLDLGASTGGFTQVLLERGARHVFAVDVGHGQMAERFRSDPRITLLENTNARDLAPAHLNHAAPDFLVCDVSFISLKLALPAALGLCGQGARAVLLVKPQFEAGREAIGKGGLLRRPSDGLFIAEGLRDWLDAQQGWRQAGLVPCPIEGADGNREFLLAGIKNR